MISLGIVPFGAEDSCYTRVSMTGMYQTFVPRLTCTHHSQSKESVTDVSYNGKKYSLVNNETEEKRKEEASPPRRYALQ